ncbi:MAG: hypothetical protein AB7F96_07145 [Beijerinckiaceae bacterium]
MHKIARNLAALSAAAPILLAGLAGHAAAASAFTSLKEPACQGAPGNAAARRDEHGHVVFQCRGAGGWSIRLLYAGTYVSAFFTPSGAKKPAFQLNAPYNIGPRIEWVSPAAHSRPNAAIVRLHVRTGSASTETALAVLGVSASRMCLAGLISGKAGYANALAREQANALPASGECRAGGPSVTGPQSEALTELLGANR